MDDPTANPLPPQSSLDEYEYEYESEDDYQYALEEDDSVIAGDGGERRLPRIVINKPIADIVRDCVLHRLPASSLFRLRAVDTSWNLFISSPIFAHTQSYTYRLISGVFCSTAFGPTVYAPFSPAAAHALPNHLLSFLPGYSIEVLSSSGGLLLCFCLVACNFFVCNPANGSWATVPKPPCDPGSDPVAVLLFIPDVYNFRHDFHIVMAFRIDGVPKGILGFQTFSSSSGEWWISREVCAVEYLYPQSGVSAGGTAFWQTSMQTVVWYEPARDRVGVVSWPMGHVMGVQWAIGAMGGSRLYCTVVTEEAIQVHKLLDQSDKWEVVVSFDALSAWDSEKNKSWDGEEVATVAVMAEEEITDWNVGADADGKVVFKNRPFPLRFQGGEMEILLWVNDKVVGVNLTTKQLRIAAAASSSSDVQGFIQINCVPYVSTLATVPSLTSIEESGIIRNQCSRRAAATWGSPRR